eukprot:CAMPEP_0168325140 /NCGR_PEP_ID=MMETSP0213-20121227/4516_1 /TAXON_ID=151035 /ORGANISM="Euplotes harpa, Strain FSP1.4" /LENGTH=124 /DNA_ID=CAMNT_0008327579 /DNA_START=90 /DNA_END=464 /DNA_ORIENTATION=+
MPEQLTKETFVPTKEDIFIYAGEKRSRLIFGHPIEFDDDENEQIEEFKQYLVDNDLELPASIDFREMYRYYQGCGYDPQLAYEGLVENYKFMQENLPVNLDGLEEYLQSGIMYYYKRDKHFRPI